MERNARPPTGFVQQRLPWLVAGACLIVYLATVSPWSAESLALLGKVAGWDWRPMLGTPVLYLLTLPVRVLPASWQAVTLGLIPVALAFLTLALLARSVALLPYDRTKEARQLERSEYSLLTIKAAWIPPLLAVLVCGLQRSFWESATTATTEMLDLFLFAYVVRCLLEYRLDEKKSWLLRSAIVYGAGITNNIAMIGFFPAYLGALVWIMGLRFFNLRFLGQMTLLGLAGLSLYLLMPAVQGLSEDGMMGFGEMFRTYLGMQRDAVKGFPRVIVLLLSLTSVLPVIFIGIRWPASVGETSQTGSLLTTLMLHVVHAAFLAACLYVAFDPPFSPRSLGGGLYALLPLYYLGALTIGYCAGYFLLVFGTKPAQPTWQRPSVIRDVLAKVLVVAVWLVLLAGPAALAVKNAPKLWANRGSGFLAMGRELAASLPATPAVVLSDSPVHLSATAAALRAQNPGHRHILVDTALLPLPRYHQHLTRRHGARWPTLPPQAAMFKQMDSASTANILRVAAQTNELFYLHPSFGFFFEHFYLRPAKLVYRMHLYPTNVLEVPVLTAAEIQAQDAYWQQARTSLLAPVLGKIPPPPARAVKEQDRASLESQPNAGEMLATFYSRAVNHFGVEVQRAGQLDKAAAYFELALQLNPRNPAAFVNQDYNRHLRIGKRGSIPPSEGATLRMSLYGGNWNFLLNQHGPVDEPNIAYLMAESFERGYLYRQTCQALLRSTQLNPDKLNPWVVLATMFSQAQFHDRALELVRKLRSGPQADELSDDEKHALLRAEAWALAGKGDLSAAEQLLEADQTRNPRRPEPFAAQVDLYLAMNRFSNATAVIERQLKTQPKNVQALINLSALKIQAGQFQEALPFAEQALAITQDNQSALINRALINLRLQRYDQAQADYEQLELRNPKSHVAAFNLAEIHYQKKNVKRSLESYRRWQKLAPPDAPEHKYVADRIERLKRGGL
jgi:tetratricopeptide (TPR) repeat protein